MLTRLEAHDAEQRRFAANASHELRTPLAITQALLDVAGKDPERESSELDERLRAVNARAIELTEALLLLSRTDQRSFARDDVDLSLVMEEATETLLPLAEKHGVAIESSGDVTSTTGSPALLLQLTMNLLHNAIVHNLPGRGAVWMHTSAGPEVAVLTVENTGEQLTPQLVATLTEPFQRGTERLRGDHVGAGLGLAIAKSIAQAHNGTLSLRPRTDGGLRVMVRLPSADERPRASPSRASHDEVAEVVQVAEPDDDQHGEQRGQHGDDPRCRGAEQPGQRDGDADADDPAKGVVDQVGHIRDAEREEILRKLEAE